MDETGPSQEDHGWYLTFLYEQHPYDLFVAYMPTGQANSGTWLACLERSYGLLGSLLGKRHRSIEPGAILVIHDVLAASELCHNVRWLFFAIFVAEILKAEQVTH